MNFDVKNIWKKLRAKNHIFALAPMEEVTDTVFRQVIARLGRPDIFFTEFTNCEGMQSAGQPQIIHRLQYTEIERPLIAQVWGITPEDYYHTTRLIREMGFDGIDINMGCPVKKIIKQGACSALIKNPSKALEIVNAVRSGAENMPVSIKTRIGFAKIQTEEWIGFLLEECKPDTLIVHGRTVKEESAVPNHWDEIGFAVQLRDKIQANIPTPDRTLILGNGDVTTYQEGLDLINQYSLDGVMVGRGIFRNPWFFDNSINYNEISIQNRIQALHYHLTLWKSTWDGKKNYQALKRFYKIYLQNFEGAVALRNNLMETKSAQSALDIIENYM